MKYFTVIACMLLSVLTGCQSNHEDLDKPEAYLNGELKLTTHIDTRNTLKRNINQPFIGSVGQGPILGSLLPDHAEIGICIHAFDGEEYTPYPSINGAKHQNQIWKNTVDGWKYFDKNGNEDAYYLSNEDAYIHAYYPFTQRVDIDNQLGLKIKIEPGYTDFMFGKAQSYPNSINPTSALEMNHALASITFTVKNHGYKGDCILEAITLHNVTADADLYVRNGSIDAGSLKTDLKVAAWKGKHYDPANANGTTGFQNPLQFEYHSLGYPSISSQSEENSLHVLVIPQKGLSEIKPDGTYLSIQIDGKEHKVAFLLTENGNNKTEFNWISGQNYNYNLILKADGELSVEVDDFSFGGNWDSDFFNPNAIITENGAEDITIPTHFLHDQDKMSKHFHISTADLPAMNWYDASGWKEIWGNNNHGSINPNPTKGCLALREGGHSDWRIPTYNEYKLMFEKKNIKNPLAGSYWIGDYAFHKDASIIQNMTKVLISGATQNNSGIKYKVRCIRDVRH